MKHFNASKPCQIRFSLDYDKKFSKIGSASGNKPRLGAMETAYIPHNHTLTVYCYTTSNKYHVV